jgi:hypothetical protein
VENAWYGIRCVFKLDDVAMYEERVAVWEAPTFDAAIALAESDAAEYAATLDMTYLGIAQAYHLPDKEIVSGSEVFSLMRESALSTEEYVRAYFNTGSEVQQDI